MKRRDYENVRTRPMAIQEVSHLIGLVASLQFVLLGLSFFVPAPFMVALCGFAAIFAWWASSHSESLKARWVG